MSVDEGTGHESAGTAALLQYIKDLKGLLPLAEIKDRLRVTPQGLFIEESLQQKLVASYQQWLQLKTGGTVAKSDRKCLKRLFGSEEPRQYYLVEGKACLLGYLVECPIQQPQNFSLPYYLGSLNSTDNYLHPRDPHLSAIPSLELVPGPAGTEMRVRVRGKSFRLQSAFVRDFQALAERSPGLQRHYPKVLTAMHEAAGALVKLLKQARVVGKKQPLLVPQRLGKQSVLLRSGSLVFVAEGDLLSGCYELRGANLYRFLRDETREAAGGRRGVRVASIELLHHHPKALGSVRIKGIPHLLAPCALQDFIERIPESHSLRGDFGGHYTVLDCLKPLSFICEQSEQIERQKIERYAALLPGKRYSFRTFERWILAVGDEQTVVHCLEKGHEPAPPSMPKQRGRGPRGGGGQPGRGRRERRGRQRGK